MKFQSFLQKMPKKKMILVTEVTARKRFESECFLQMCEIWLNYVRHLKNNKISWWPYIKNEIASMKLQSLCNKMIKKKMILVTGIIARK